MTIAITLPATGTTPLGRLGIGAGLTGTISGPTLLDDTITVTLTDSFVGQIVASGTSRLEGLTSWSVYLDTALPPTQRGTADGRTLTAQAEARHANGTIFDSNSWAASYVNDPHSFVVGSMSRLLETAVAGALVDTRSSVEGMTLSTSSPIALTSPYTGSGTLSLTGTTPRPVGLEWQIDTAPPGAGLVSGDLATYEDRVLQLVAYYLVDGNYVADELVGTRLAQGIALTKHGLLDHLDYWVTPGFSVNLWWLLAA